MGPEDDDEVPRRQRPGLYLLVEGRNGFQRHHSQKQVSENDVIFIHFYFASLNQSLILLLKRIEIQYLWSLPGFCIPINLLNC